MTLKNKVIVLGGSHGGLAIARSLVKHDIKVFVLTIDPTESGLKSKFIKDWQICPHPRDEQAFVEFLMNLPDEWKESLIMPTSDYFATAVSRYKDRLSDCFTVAVADWEHTKLFLEKDSTYRLADELDVPHPHFSQPATMDELDTQIDKMQFPIMIKPVHSHSFTGKFNTKLFINNTAEELRNNFQKVLNAQEDVIVSEIIPGNDYRTLETVQIYINSKGEVAATFCCIKLRQIPPMYGVMRAGTSMPPSQELIDLGLKLLQNIDYRGYASIEFKRDPRDNQLKLIEVNIRALRISQLPTASGVDFPYMIYQDLMHDNQIHVDSYNPEMHYNEIGADIPAYFLLDEDRNISRFIEPYKAKHRTHPYLRFDDPMPFLAEIWRRGMKLIKK
jgi:D-aspartate ligase